MSVEGGRMFPSVATLARETRLAKATVSKWLGTLRDKDLIRVVSGVSSSTGAPRGGRRSTEYAFGPTLRACLHSSAGAEDLDRGGQPSTNDTAALHEREGSHLPGRSLPSTKAIRSEDLPETSTREPDQRREPRAPRPGGEGQAGEELLAAFKAEWEIHYDGETFVTAERDVALADRLAAQLDIEQLRERMRRFFTAENDFYFARRHPFALFAEDINTLGADDDDGWERVARKRSFHAT
jgi:hypothetical protein